ncbi:MAG: carbohydrate ABC transporter permease [Clostridia bacterium]|jgi:putative aldouronate transport system permease protein|nr:carbohydrate ABC transporter permease [Clostridia bacterium]
MAQISLKRKKPSRYFIRQSRGEKVFGAANIMFMLFMLVIFLYPLLNMFSISVSNQYAILRAEVSFFPRGFDTVSYKLIFANQDIWRSIGNSLFVALAGCALSLLLTCVAAYPLAFGDFYGKKLFNILILFTMWFNGGIIPTFLTIRQLGLHDTLWSLIVNSMLVAYNVVIVRSYFQSIPQSVVESARIDGANDYLILFKLIIPLSKPVLATVALWVIVGHWNDYLNSLLFLSSRHNYTLQLVLKELVLNAEASIHNISMSSDSSTSGAAALGQQMRNGVLVVSMIPMIILYPFVQRYFISGVMLGSVKG